jgi:FAD/FMN-containing dehydrogenase
VVFREVRYQPMVVLELSLERMNRILEIDIENLIVVVEPGVITNDINRQLKNHGLFYADISDEFRNLSERRKCRGKC